MLRFEIISIIPHSFDLVRDNFSESLFEALAPVFPPSQLISFDGDRVGGLVKIKLGLDPLSTVWISEITRREEESDRLVFVDEGRALPFPLKNWRHQHLILREPNAHTKIVDDISFSSGLKLIDYLMYPVLKIMFGMRTSAYLKFYSQLSS